jgi:hypothetical protein
MKNIDPAFEVVEVFEISNRGTVVLLNADADSLPLGKYRVEIEPTSGGIFSATAHQECLLRRSMQPS